WTIVLGLVVGIPLFIMKEVTGIWADLGLPEIHYTIMSTIMMCLGIATHMGISALTAPDDKENLSDLVWSGQEAREVFTKIETPFWQDRTLWAGLLVVCTAGFIIWFW
ncbi:MAG: SSS family solute/sodium (Na+) symporter, partial [Pseudomonadota bacterium]